MKYEMNSSNNETSWNTTIHVCSASDSHPEALYYYICLIFVVFPGFLTNSLALLFIIKDVRKAVFPAIVLLLTLISADLVADIFTGVHMAVSLYVTDKTYNICAPISVLHTFFRMYSGILNAMMSIDRVLAICTPYFYKRRVHVLTWKLGCLLSAVCSAMFCLFPVVGLGNVMIQRYKDKKLVNVCSTFSYQEETHKKIYSAMYGIFGVTIILTIVLGNSMVIRSIYKMRKRIIPINVELSSSTDYDCSNTTNVSSFEIAFAKLMGCLALVYLICGTPMNVSIFWIYLFPNKLICWAPLNRFISSNNV